MPYILDGIIILIVLICVILSAKRGFVRTLIEVAGFIAAIIIAFTFSSPLSGVVYDKMIEPTVIKTVESTATESAENANAAVDAVWAKLPKFITENNFFGLSKDKVSQEIQNETANSSVALANSISDSFVEPVAIKILSMLFSTILVVVLIFVFKFLAKYINKLFSFSLVCSINKTLGGILGLIKGLAIAVIFCMIITLILSLTKNGFLIFTYDAINASYIFKFIAEFSPFV